MLTWDELVRAIADPIWKGSNVDDAQSRKIADEALTKLAAVRGPCRLSIDAVLDVKRAQWERESDLALQRLSM